MYKYPCFHHGGNPANSASCKGFPRNLRESRRAPCTCPCSSQLNSHDARCTTRKQRETVSATVVTWRRRVLLLRHRLGRHRLRLRLRRRVILRLWCRWIRLLHLGARRRLLHVTCRVRWRSGCGHVGLKTHRHQRHKSTTSV